jgi:hypothetical protein
LSLSEFGFLVSGVVITVIAVEFRIEVIHACIIPQFVVNVKD